MQEQQRQIESQLAAAQREMALKKSQQQQQQVILEPGCETNKRSKAKQSTKAVPTNEPKTPEQSKENESTKETIELAESTSTGTNEQQPVSTPTHKTATLIITTTTGPLKSKPSNVIPIQCTSTKSFTLQNATGKDLPQLLERYRVVRPADSTSSTKTTTISIKEVHEPVAVRN